MTQGSLPDPGSLSPAESLFAQYLAEVELGRAPDFEAVCKAHPAAARELRELKSHWERLRTIEHKAGLGGKPRASLGDELRSRFGSDVDPGVSLSGAEPNEDSGPSSELLHRLQAHQPANSRYKLLGEVGRGGMGAVLKIWDEDLRRTLAMKVVLGKDDPAKPGSTPPVDSRTLGRFLEEAQVTGQLDHPGIVPVHELGLDSTGRVYFTMRLIKGEDLRRIYEHVESGHDGWNETRALGVLLKVCEAMSYAHDKHVVHRDLKPANVMVGKYGEVYVMDWGLARVLGQKDRHDVRLKPEAPTSASIRTERRSERDERPDSPLVTMDGDVVGTPAYMPPEQARGDVDQLGPHSDVYAVGAMLYHLLARQMPFVPPHTRVSAHMVLMRVLEGPPKPLIEFAPHTPAELVAICEKAMEREPKRRYRDMVELAEDLRAYLERRVVKAYESGTWAETKKWVQRNKPLAVSLASAVVVLVAGVITSLLYADEANAARKDLSEKITALAEATQLAERRADTESRLKNEALARERQGKVRGLIQELEYFDSLDDDVYTYARQQTRPAHEWWIESARKLVDGVEEDLANNIPWSPGLKDVEAELARVRERALPRTPEEAEQDRQAVFELRRSWLFATSEDEWWHTQLVQLSMDLRGLLARVAHAEASVRGPAAARAWVEAIAEIAASEKYRGTRWPSGDRLTPQLGLVPIGKDSTSGLWEFADIQTGEPPTRGADGVLRIGPASALVFILIPGRPKESGSRPENPPVRAAEPENPHLISKYECSITQWRRVSRWTGAFEYDGQDPIGVNNVSAKDCLEMCRTLGWWVRLPTREEWIHAARGGTHTTYWTGDDTRSLAGYENTRPKGVGGILRPMSIDKMSSNPFGFCDMLGGFSEWCQPLMGESEVRELRYEGEWAAGTQFAWLCGGNLESDFRAAPESRLILPWDIRSSTSGCRFARDLVP